MRAPPEVPSLKPMGVFCTEPPERFGQNTKILFVVDKSGSNVTASNGGPPTDPDKSRRSQAMELFFSAHKDNAYIKWGLITFQGSTAKALTVSNTDPASIFTDTSADFVSAIEQFKSDADAGGTPYVAALGHAQNGIAYDLEKNARDNSYYNVIFISDGMPQDPEGQVLASVKSLIGLATSQIRLSTVYYGSDNATAIQLLSNMAKEGNGKFQNAQLNEKIDIESLITGGGYIEPYSIKKLMVYNLNSAPCLDGFMGPDSDADGLCDEDEEHYNEVFHDKLTILKRKFEVDNRNSIDSVYSDFFMVKILQGQMSPPCQATQPTDEDFDLLNECEENFLKSTTPVGPTPDWSKKMVATGNTGDPKNFDSDGDGIIDILELFYYNDKSAPLNFNNAKETPFGFNGPTNEYLIKNHLHPIHPENSVSYNGTLTKISQNADGQYCYNYQQPELPLYNILQTNMTKTSNHVSLAHAENENVILVYYIQTPESEPYSKGSLRYSYQKLLNGRDGPGSIRMDTAYFDLYLAEEKK